MAERAQIKIMRREEGKGAPSRAEKMLAQWLLLPLLSALSLLAACPPAEQGISSSSAPATSVKPSSPLRIFVSIAPQAYLAEQLGQRRISVEILVPAGQSPETYEPSPQQMVALSRAQLFLAIGVPFERSLLAKLKTPPGGLTIVPTQQGIQLRHETTETTATSTAAESALARARENPAVASVTEHHAHQHPLGLPDAHIWLDPRRTMQIARTMAQALIKADPPGEEEYKKNVAALEARLSQLDSELERQLTSVKGRALYVYHDAWGYFCERYGLQQRAIAPGGKEPGGHSFATFIEHARMSQARAIFVQPQSSQREARAVAQAIGARVVVIDPLARDYLANMRSIARAILQGLEHGR